MLSINWRLVLPLQSFGGITIVLLFGMCIISMTYWHELRPTWTHNHIFVRNVPSTRYFHRFSQMHVSTDMVELAIALHPYWVIRPISNLRFLLKLVERLVVERFNYCGLCNRLTDNIITIVYNDIVQATDAGEVSVLGIMDLTAAFETTYSYLMYFKHFSASNVVHSIGLGWSWQHNDMHQLTCNSNVTVSSIKIYGIKI